MNKLGINTVGTRAYMQSEWSRLSKLPGTPDGDYIRSWQYKSVVWPEYLGDPWNSTLAKIDKTFAELDAIGVKIVREWAVPVKWNFGDLSNPIVVSDSDKWEAVDRAVECAKYYGMQIILTGSSCLYFDAFTSKVTNQLIPHFTFVADRYKDYQDTVIINPYNELNLAYNYWTGGRCKDVSGFAELQKLVYQAVKSVSSLRVYTASFYCGDNYSLFSDPISFLQKIYYLGYANYFDDCFLVHLYPKTSDVLAAGSYKDYTAPRFAGSMQDVDDLIQCLNTIGRSDAKVCISEFGTFWSNVPENEVQTRKDLSYSQILDVDERFKYNDRVHSYLYWTTIGTDRVLPSLDNSDPDLLANKLAATAMKGGGILNEADKYNTKFTPYYAFPYVNRVRQLVEPISDNVPTIAVLTNDADTIAIDISKDSKSDLCVEGDYSLFSSIQVQTFVNSSIMQLMGYCDYNTDVVLSSTDTMNFSTVSYNRGTGSLSTWSCMVDSYPVGLLTITVTCKMRF